MGVYVRKTATGGGAKIWPELGGTARGRAGQASSVQSEGKRLEHPALVFGELCELLDAYGPRWYTEEIAHGRLLRCEIFSNGVFGEVCPIQ